MKDFPFSAKCESCGKERGKHITWGPGANYTSCPLHDGQINYSSYFTYEGFVRGPKLYGTSDDAVRMKAKLCEICRKSWHAHYHPIVPIENFFIMHCEATDSDGFPYRDPIKFFTVDGVRFGPPPSQTKIIKLEEDISQWKIFRDHGLLPHECVCRRPKKGCAFHDEP